MLKRRIAAILAIVFIAALLGASGPAFGTEDHEYRWSFQSDLDPYADPQEDPQMSRTGTGDVSDIPQSTLDVYKSDGAGTAWNYHYIPEVRNGEWIVGSFQFNVKDFYAERTRYSGIHKVRAENGSGVYFSIKQATDNTFGVQVDIRSNGTAVVCSELISTGYSQDTWYTVSYTIQVTASTNASDKVTATIGDDTAEIGANEKTWYNSNYTRLSYGVGGGHTVETQVDLKNATAKIYKDESAPKDDIIDPGIAANARWSLATSLDPLSTPSDDPNQYENNDKDVAELSSGLRTGAWNYGLEADTNGGDTSLFIQFIPGVTLAPEGLSAWDSGAGAIDGDITIKGKFYLKNILDDEMDSGEETLVHALYSVNRETGIVFKIVHEIEGMGEDTTGKLRVEVLEKPVSTVVIDDYDESDSVDWADDWYCIQYEFTRLWDVGHAGPPEVSPHWDDYTLSVSIYDTAATPNLIDSLSLSGDYDGGLRLRRAEYGIEADSNRSETWHLDDAWISVGIRDFLM